MLIKILGIVDVIIALLFFIHNSFDKIGWFPNNIIMWAGIILLIKGIFFLAFLDFASIVDIIGSIVIIVSAFISIYWLLAFIVIIFLIQKGLLSLVS